jgi:hypothetical protein
VVAEAKLAEGLGLQVRYGHDARVNNALSPTNNSIFAPGAAGNLYADPATGQIGTKWAFNMNFPVLNPFHTGARGYRAALVYQKNLGRWGSHQASAFHQDMESWTNQDQWRFYEADASGNAPVNPALISVADLGRVPMPSFWVPVNPTALVGGKKWPFSSLVHPNGKTYVSQPLIFPGAVPPTAGNPLGLSGPINATTGQTSVSTSVYGYDDTRETSYGFSAFSSWWKERIDTMVGYRSEEAVAKRVQTGLLRGPITYDSLKLFDQAFNQRCIDNGWANTLLGMQMGIDLGMESNQVTLDPYWHKLWHSQQITREALDQAIRSQNNVVKESRFVLRVRK